MGLECWDPQSARILGGCFLGEAGAWWGLYGGAGFGGGPPAAADVLGGRRRSLRPIRDRGLLLPLVLR